LTGWPFNRKTFIVHLDGYNFMDMLTGKAPGPRKGFFYWTDDGDFAGLRYDKWKLVFLEQRTYGLDVWRDRLVVLRVPFGCRDIPGDAPLRPER
jgi:arylsulfatase A-like enzyme